MHERTRSDERAHDLSDEAVVALVQAGDTARFETIMRRHNQRLFRVARAILRNDADAEDAVQETYVSAYKHLAQFSGASSFGTWLMRIGVNEASTRARRRGRRAEVALPDDGEVYMSLRAETPSPESELSRRELTRLLEASIDALPASYRVVMMLRAVEELSTAETAQCLALSEEVVRVRLHRGKKLLRAALLTRAQARAGDAFAFLGARCDRIVHAVLTRLGVTPTGAG